MDDRLCRSRPLTTSMCRGWPLTSQRWPPSYCMSSRVFFCSPLCRAVGTVTACSHAGEKVDSSVSSFGRRRCRDVDCILVSHLLRTSISAFRIQSAAQWPTPIVGPTLNRRNLYPEHRVMLCVIFGVIQYFKRCSRLNDWPCLQEHFLPTSLL